MRAIDNNYWMSKDNHYMNHTLNTSSFRRTCKFSTAPRFKQHLDRYSQNHVAPLISSTTSLPGLPPDPPTLASALGQSYSIPWQLRTLIDTMSQSFLAIAAEQLLERVDSEQLFDQLHMKSKEKHKFHLLIPTTACSREVRGGLYEWDCRVRLIKWWEDACLVLENTHKWKWTNRANTTLLRSETQEALPLEYHARNISSRQRRGLALAHVMPSPFRWCVFR